MELSCLWAAQRLLKQEAHFLQLQREHGQSIAVDS
jgi:hypothetical protein